LLHPFGGNKSAMSIEPNWLQDSSELLIVSIQGSLWRDGWMAKSVDVTCQAPSSIKAVTLQGWNPDWSSIYAGNQVSIEIGSFKVSTPPMAMGQIFELEIEVQIGAGEEFIISISSDVSRPPDALDPRERSIMILELSDVGAETPEWPKEVTS